ncbi:ABC transporter permease [Streptomyces himalayensis]|uniref:ABC transporter permease n=1 Tax=Streptomyces himalayensis subsp. himalayensis TaxID=2756131 RepID=A0A7W0IBQ7_9ACTN|nr:ABC transporter permease [Streptomyces himalayensis]MBA2949401.1 ABC transporter permease [Streptomyces himalayensis subsp. himalayensis]
MTAVLDKAPQPSASAGTARPRARGARGSSGARWLFLPPLALLLLGLAGPLVAVVVAGSEDHGPAGMFTEPFRSALFLRAAWRTLWMAALVTLCTGVLGVLYALALGLARKALSHVLFGVLFLTFWISLLVRTYGWVLMLQPQGALDGLAKTLGLSEDGLGLYQTLPGLIPAMVHIMLPYMVLPVYAGLRSLDPAQLRAARSLGAGEWLVMRTVVLPALRPGAAAGAVIVFVMSLGFFVTPAFLGGPGSQVTATVIGTEFGRMQNLGGAAAMGVVLLVATLGLYVVADRFLKISEQWERV